MSTVVLDFENMSFDELDRLEAESPALLGSKTAGIPYSARKTTKKRVVVTRATLYNDQFGRSFEILPLKPIHRPGLGFQLKKYEKVKVKNPDPENFVVRVGSKDWRLLIDKQLLAEHGLAAKDLTFRVK